MALEFRTERTKGSVGGDGWLVSVIYQNVRQVSYLWGREPV